MALQLPSDGGLNNTRNATIIPINLVSVARTGKVTQALLKDQRHLTFQCGFIAERLQQTICTRLQQRRKRNRRHVSAASRPHPESGDAPARETTVLDPVGEKRPHRVGCRGPAPGAAAGNHSPTITGKLAPPRN